MLAAELQGKLKATKEQNSKSDEKPKRFTTVELQAAVDEGKISQGQMTEYLIETKAEEFYERKVHEQEAREATIRPIENALKEIKEYRQYLPWLNDKTDPKFAEVEDEFDDLVQKGYPSNQMTEALAVRHVAGSLASLKKTKDMHEFTRTGATVHAENSAGGADKSSLVKDVVDKVPKELVEGWRKMGSTEVEIKKYAKRHFDKMAARRARFG